MRDATAPAMAASVPDINTDSQAERFTISLADVADGVEQVVGLFGTGQAPSEPNRRSAASALSVPVTSRSVIAIR